MKNLARIRDLSASQRIWSPIFCSAERKIILLRILIVTRIEAFLSAMRVSLGLLMGFSMDLSVKIMRCWKREIVRIQRYLKKENRASVEASFLNIIFRGLKPSTDLRWLWIVEIYWGGFSLGNPM
jgi:hypothetical protein